MKPKPRAISDTSFLSVMNDIGYLNLCSVVFERVYISKSVYDEVEQSGIRSLTACLEELIVSGFIIVKKCSNFALVNSLKSFLGSGEAETMALALELEEADVVILDELKARNLYEKLGIDKRLIGTIGVLKFMLTHGIIEESVDAVIKKLEQAGFRFKRDLFKNC